MAPEPPRTRADRQSDAGLLASAYHLLRIRYGGGDRLVDEHVFSLRGGRHGEFRVLVVGRRDDHGVHVRALDDRLVARLLAA